MKNIIRKFVPLGVRRIFHDAKNAPGLRKEIARLKGELLYYNILFHFNENPSPEFKNELSYLKQEGKLTIYPYRQIRNMQDIEGGFDKVKKMPYVLHNSKKLFFPRGWSFNGARNIYANYIETENILGGGYKEKSPHQYLTEKINVNEGDIVIDVGAAEGLFLLEVIEKVKRAYIIEPNKNWLIALKATFEPYKNKVTIIEKYATDTDSATETKLDSCIDAANENIFMKMDVEGFEQKVLSGAGRLLKQEKIRVACCTYHKQNDADELNTFFREKGFQTEFSDGYMLFPYDEYIQPPYFRKGMIRAFKSGK